MDVIIFVFFTLIAFICLFCGYLFKSAGLATAFNVIAMMIFVLIGLILVTPDSLVSVVNGNNITILTTNATGVIITPLNLGLSNEHIGIVYLLLALISLYAET